METIIHKKTENLYERLEKFDKKFYLMQKILECRNKGNNILIMNYKKNPDKLFGFLACISHIIIDFPEKRGRREQDSCFRRIKAYLRRQLMQ